MKRIIIFTVFITFLTSLAAEIKLPRIFSDNIVLQRDEPLNVWGWADKGERVEIEFNGQKRISKADKHGRWQISFSPMQYGGPYTMTVKGKTNSITLNNILIGDVWICSGQSNMEWILRNVQNAKSEINDANYPEIRSFNVKREMNLRPQDDFNGKWEVCTPETADGFSAVGYFFARKIYQETGIPIGFINASWGGTNIEAWTSSESFMELPVKFRQGFDPNYTNVSEEFFNQLKTKKQQYENALINDTGTKEKWYSASTGLSDWKTLPVPQLWKERDLVSIDGVVWCQYEFELGEEVAGKPAVLNLGMIDDNDETWFNGVRIGATEGYATFRTYTIPAGTVKPGINRISVKIIDTGGGGGIYGSDDDVSLVIGGKNYPLADKWHYKIAESNEKHGYITYSPNNYPSSLYNSMIHPIRQFPVKGAIWYQGESNAGKAHNYRTLFPNMIRGWRKQWKKEFPFYWVQLANYMQEDSVPQESAWAELREAQTMALSLEKTGQAVIIDIGEANDVHPRNKRDVGLRLALNALNKDYGRSEIVYSGPMYRSMQIENNKAILHFDTFGSKIKTKSKYGYVQGFTVAGSDKEFVWAKAYIDGDNVVVYSEEVKNPAAVRYNWGNNPDGNLYNEENLPACPFRTDNWKGITEVEN